MGLIEQVAKLLEVEIGESFNIGWTTGDIVEGSPFKFSKDALLNADGMVSSDELGMLIS